jgi:hypothetical protein
MNEFCHPFIVLRVRTTNETCFEEFAMFSVILWILNRRARNFSSEIT